MYIFLNKLYFLLCILIYFIYYIFINFIYFTKIKNGSNLLEILITNLKTFRELISNLTRSEPP